MIQPGYSTINGNIAKNINITQPKNFHYCIGHALDFFIRISKHHAPDL